MVESPLNWDTIFGSLADPTRRHILERLACGELSVGEIAKPYQLTFAAISKHLKVLEKSQLVVKRRQGKEQIVRLAPETLAAADAYLLQYRVIWERRMDALEDFLAEEQAALSNKGGFND